MALPADSKTIPDGWYNALTTLQETDPFIFEGDGITPLTPENYHRNDWWFAWLRSVGGTGQMNDMELQYWLAVYVPPPVTGNAFSDGFDSGFGA